MRRDRRARLGILEAAHDLEDAGALELVVRSPLERPALARWAAAWHAARGHRRPGLVLARDDAALVLTAEDAHRGPVAMLEAAAELVEETADRAVLVGPAAAIVEAAEELLEDELERWQAAAERALRLA